MNVEILFSNHMDSSVQNVTLSVLNDARIKFKSLSKQWIIRKVNVACVYLTEHKT